MKFGLLGARADRGGLAAQTREFHRHLRPDRTLLVDLGSAGRGPCDPSWYPGAFVTTGVPSQGTVAHFLNGLDVVWAFETPYLPDAFDLARSLGVRSVLYANPELWHAELAPPDVVVAATGWRLDLLPPGAQVLPFPVARDRLPFRRRTAAETFVHVAAPAMLDRNGTRLVLAAMRYVTRRCRLIVRGYPGRLPQRIGRVEIIHDRSDPADYWEGWPDDGDVLLLPRRYAGLSLPMQEAMSLGMPVVSLDLTPQNAWLPPETLVPAVDGTPYRMAGGRVHVARASSRDLARVVNRLVDDPALVARCSDLANEHAATISWETMLPRYQALLADVGQESHG